jgi:hypothetical protein
MSKPVYRPPQWLLAQMENACSCSLSLFARRVLRIIKMLTVGLPAGDMKGVIAVYDLALTESRLLRRSPVLELLGDNGTISSRL